MTNPSLKKLPQNTTSNVFSRESACIVPRLKITKDGVNMLIIRRPLRTISISEQGIDVFTRVDIPPARRPFVGPILERLPAPALPRLSKANGAGVVVTGVKGSVVGGAKNVLA